MNISRAVEARRKLRVLDLASVVYSTTIMAKRSPSQPGHAAEQAAEYPVSVRFSATLRQRAQRFATKSHVGLGTAIRTMVGEYLDEVDARQDLTRAEAWQRAQAWSTAGDLLKRKVPEVTLDDLRADERTALDALRRRGSPRR